MANIIERWDLIKLENILDFYIGGDWGEQEPINSNYIATKVLRATDISNWENDHGENAQIRYLKDNSLAKRQLKENDLIIEVSGGSPDQPVGRTIIISSDDIQKFQYPVTCSNFFRLLRFNNKINPKFINYYFKFLYETKIIESYQSNSTNLRNLKFSQFLNQNIPVPQTLGEQQEIVDVLDVASEIVRLRTACIESAQFLIPALFQEMFGDPLSKVDKNKIGYYFDVGTGATPRRENSEYYEGNIPWVKTTEVDNCYINSTSEHISESAIKETNCSLYPPGTILMAMYGQGKTRGKVAYLNISATTNQACAALQLKKEYENDVNLIYVFYYLQIIYEFLRTLSQGGGRPNMNLSIVRNIPLYLPDIKQQELFAEKVQEIEEYIKSQQAELENAKIMFQSLLHHAFPGELTRHKFGGDTNG